MFPERLDILLPSMNMTNPTGQSYTAKLDGTDARNKRDSKTITTKRYMATSSDGKTMTVIRQRWRDRQRDCLGGCQTLLIVCERAYTTGLSLG
jgi:hypothetical protein